VADQLIAEALYPYPADLVLSTKVGVRRGEDGSWLPDAAPASLREQVESSLRRLRVEALGLVHLRLPDGVALAESHVPLEASFSQLASLVEEDKIRNLGLSSASVDQLEAAQTIAPVISVQNLFNISDRGDEQMVDRCADDGIAYLAFFPLGRGALTGDRLTATARALDLTPAQVALAWLLQRAPVIVPIPGTTSIRHLEENFAVTSVDLGGSHLSALTDAPSPND